MTLRDQRWACAGVAMILTALLSDAWCISQPGEQYAVILPAWALAILGVGAMFRGLL